MKRIKDMFFTYHGRMNRWTYFTHRLGIVVTYFIIATFVKGHILSSTSIYTNEPIETSIYIIFALFIGFTFVVLAALLSISIRRLHDLEKGFMFALFEFVGLVPIVGGLIGLIYQIILFFVPGTKGENYYGKDPLSLLD